MALPVNDYKNIFVGDLSYVVKCAECGEFLISEIITDTNPIEIHVHQCETCLLSEIKEKTVEARTKLLNILKEGSYNVSF
jgi:hypothetical protein